MPILETTDSSQKESSLQSNAAAFFEDAYADHKVAGATMAVGMLAITRGKSGAGLLATELAASGAAKGAVVAVEAGGAKLAAEAMAHPGAMRNLLLEGTTHIEAPAARGMALLQMKVGLPRTVDAATTTKLAEGIAAKDSAAVGSVMDDIFNGNSYTAMRNRFGG